MLKEQIFANKILINAELEVSAFLVQIVLICPHSQLVTGSFVADDDGMGVHLEHGGGPLVGDVAVDAVLEGAGFLVAVAHKEDFPGSHDGADADGEGLLGDQVEVAFEEAAVGVDGVGGEGFDSCLAGERGAGFVEGEVAVGAYAAHEEVDAAGGFDGFLVVVTFFYQIGRIAVEDMDVLRLDVDMGEKIGPHEAVVAFGVVFGQVDVFIHVERDDVLEGEFACLIFPNEFPVEAERRGAGRASELERLWLASLIRLAT